MQPHLTMPQVWIHEVREVREAGVEFGDGLGKRLWKYGWGLVFVLAMTLLAEYGPRTVYSKVAPAPAAASEPAVHSVK